MKLPHRRQFLHVAVGAAALPAVSRMTWAQTYPTRPVTLIVPNPASTAGTDFVGRVVAERMKEPLGRPIVIENVGGADGSIGVRRLARAAPDGYTIGLGSTSTHVMNGAFYSLPYDVLNDFEPISPLATAPYILFARKAMPSRDLKELITWLKANPDKASSAIATSVFRVLNILFQKETSTQFQFVPYRGGSPAMQDLLAGQIDLYFGTATNLPFMRAGSIKAYAVTSDRRLRIAPDIPTFGEMGFPTLSFSVWFGFFAPKGTPREIISRLNAAAVEALADPAVQSRFIDLGLEIFPRERQTPEALGALQRSDAEKWWPIIKAAGIKAE
jgi:tripartite-type tricarboxylate transporter receptor subunit TctC